MLTILLVWYMLIGTALVGLLIYCMFKMINED